MHAYVRPNLPDAYQDTVDPCCTIPHWRYAFHRSVDLGINIMLQVKHHKHS